MNITTLFCIAELPLFLLGAAWINTRAKSALSRVKADFSLIQARLNDVNLALEISERSLAHSREMLADSEQVRAELVDEIHALKDSGNDVENELRRASGFIGSPEEIDRQFIRLFAQNQTLTRDANEWCKQIDTAIAETDSAVSDAIEGFMDIAKRSDQTAKNAQEIINGGNESSIVSLADLANHTMSKFAQHNDESAAEVSHLSTSIDATLKVSAKMYKLLDELERIHGQTNMLSFNASVESARVGKEGGGFAVVASELRRLSMRSEDAASRLRQLTIELDTHNVEVKSGLSSVSQVILERSSKTEREMSSVLVLICDTLLNAQQSVTNLTELSQRVVSDIGNVVTALQFQDLLRQRLEHVSRPLKKLSDSTGSPDQQSTTAHEESMRWTVNAAAPTESGHSGAIRHAGMPPTLEIVSYERIPDESDNVTLF